MRVSTQEQYRVQPIKPVSKITRIKDDEKSPGEAFIISETAERFMRIFVFGIGPLYAIWLIVQALSI